MTLTGCLKHFAHALPPLAVESLVQGDRHCPPTPRVGLREGGEPEVDRRAAHRSTRVGRHPLTVAGNRQFRSERDHRRVDRHDAPADRESGRGAARQRVPRGRDCDRPACGQRGRRAAARGRRRGINGSASRPSSATMNGTRCAIRPATKATSRDSRSSLATTTLHFEAFAAAREAASWGRRSSASDPLPVSNSTNSAVSTRDSQADFRCSDPRRD